MQEIIELISKYGVSLVIVGLFLYDWLTTRKDMLPHFSSTFR